MDSIEDHARNDSFAPHPRGHGSPGGIGTLGALHGLRTAVCLAVAIGLLVGDARTGSASPIYRLELHLAADATTRPQPLLFTVGGPVYCMQLANLAHHLNASLACTDYGPNRYEGTGGRALREEDWGDPAYDAAVAHVPDQLRARGVKISQLVIVGVSYSGYADAELVATHPEMHPAALVVVDSYLDLTARYQALPPTHETRLEIERVLGGTPTSIPAAYAARSPSHHLGGLAVAMQAGMKLIVVWSLAASEKHEFHGATCSRLANAQWLADLATLEQTPVVGYTTRLKHAHALWDRGQGLLRLAGIIHSGKTLRAHPVVFPPNDNPPAASHC